MAPFSLKAVRKLCLKKVLTPQNYFAIKRLRRLRFESLHKRKSFDVKSYSDTECKLLFRFTSSEMHRIASTMKIPKKIKLPNGMEFKGVEGLAILLRRLSYPNRLYDLVKLFGRDTTSISRICNWMTNWIYQNFSHCIRTLDQTWLNHKKWSEFAEVCSAAGSLYPNIVGFIDGTGRSICRPQKNQENYYSGYYKEHLVKYQGIMLPNGIIGRIDGPFIGKRHDSAIIHLSRVIPEMQKLLVNNDGTWFSLYGDAGYANQKFVKVGFKNHSRLTDLQKKFNYDMSALRVSVEYGFGKIIQLFAFLDFKKNQKILLQNLKEQYIVAGIFTNIHTCLRGSQVSEYFQCEPPTLEEYLSSK